jgi:hypothetical protein
MMTWYNPDSNEMKRIMFRLAAWYSTDPSRFAPDTARLVDLENHSAAALSPQAIYRADNVPP